MRQPDSGADPSVSLTDRDLSALRFAVDVVRGVEQGLEERHPDDPNPITGTREGEATSDVLAAIVARAELAEPRKRHTLTAEDWDA